MKKNRATIVLAMLAIACGASLLAAADEEPSGAPPPDDPRFRFLKQLEGTWTGAPHHEGMAESRFEFHVTAGGHAVEEREMVGTPMEMLTVYHMDGRDLVATHYCMLGNQPRVKAAERVVDGSLSFACAGTPGNAGSHDEQHVHGWTMKLDPQGRLHYAGELLEDGEASATPAFVLSRR